MANPKFNWDPALKQVDDLTQRIQKGKLSVGEYWDTYRNGIKQATDQQLRLTKAFSTPVGTNGASAMTVPSTATINPTITAMERMNKQWAIQSEVLSGLGTKVQDWGKNTQWAGRQLMVGFTVPFAMAAAAAGKYAMDIDKALTRIEKVYDGSTKGLREEATAVAMGITQTLGTTVQSSLEIMGELAAAGKQGAEMYALTTQAQRMSVLGDIDKTESIKAVISMSTIYGLNTKQLADSINYLNAVDAKTPTSMKDLADSIPIAGATVKQLGGDLKETTILLTAFKERGISTEEGANAIKSAMNRVLVPTAQAKKLFEEFTHQNLEAVVAKQKGDPLDTMQALSDAIMGGNVALEDQQRIISKLFGTYQSTRITGLLQGLQSDTGAVAATKELSAKSDGELRDIAAKHEKAIVESASRQFTIAVESFKTNLKEFGDAAMAVGTVVINVFSKVFSFFNDLPAPIKYLAIAVGVITALAGPVVMMTGLIGNLFGSVIKIAAYFKGLGRGTGAMTLEQKAAQLAADGMTNSMMKESEAAQILIVQMGKLLGAIQAVDTAQTRAAITPSTMLGGGMAMSPNQTRAIQNPVTGSWRTNTGQAIGAEEAAQLNAQMALNKEKENTVKTETKVAEEVKKTSLAQKAFSSEALMGAGAVAGLGSMVAETGSGLEKWLTWISLGSVALSAMMPVLAKVKTAVAGMDIFQSLTGSGIASKLGGFASKITGVLKGAFSAAMGFITSPMGLAIGGALVVALGVTKLLSAESEKQQQTHQDILKSTDDWTKALGRTKIEWGQIKNTAGQVQDTVASMAEKMKTDNAPMVERFRNVKDAQELQWMANTQVGNLQGQGMNEVEIRDAMEALLRAAGKTRDEISRILSNIRVTFDFLNGEKDFDAFMGTIKKKSDALQMNLFSDKSTQYDESGNASMTGTSFDNLTRQTEELAQQFKDRIANMSDTDRAIFAKKFADQMAKGYSDGFQQLNQQSGGKLGKDWQEARSKFMEFNQKSGEWQLNNAGQTQIDGDSAQKLVYLAKEESDLTKAIAKANGASDEQVKKFSVIGDVMPLMSQGVGDATKTQNDYNRAVSEYEKGAGRKMTDAEKEKLATMYAGVTGLNASILATNGYARANTYAEDTVRANAKGILNLVQSLKDATNAGKDMWTAFADQGGGGFSMLGADANAQAQKLTESQKSVMSGTMNDVYSAYASSADEIWKNRLDNITKTFEAKKNALQKQITDFDNNFQNQQTALQDRQAADMTAFKDRWTATMDATKQSFDNRQKAIEDEAAAQTDSIDKQITAIQDQQAAEADLETARQKQFDAEKMRIERLNTLANNRIDYNRAIGSGNLDEAARVQNNSDSVTLGWSIDDANQRATDKATAKSKLSDKQIKDLEATKSLVSQQKQAKLDALKAEEDAVNKSLAAQQEAENRALQASQEAQKRAMQASHDIEKQRLQDKLDSMAQEQTAAENKERKMQEMNKRTLDIQLATLKAYVPQNEAELNAHINKVGGAYGEFGLNLQGAGSQWGQIVGNALQNNVDIARQQMSSDVNWSAFGAQVADSISKGAFGLNLNDFMNLLRTGNPPPGWAPPAPQTIQQRSSDLIHYRHTGGVVDDSLGSRAGITGDGLHSSEIPMVLQRGEFVINKDAVQRLGTQNLQRINAGGPQAVDPGAGLTGISGMIAGVMGRMMTTMAVNKLAEHYAAQNSAIASALGFTSGGGTGAAVDFAKAQDGKPYIWGGVGPAGYDCSGYMSAIANVLTGKPPNQRIFATGMVQNGAAFGPFVPGLGGKFEIGVSQVHTAGTLLGTNVESTGDHVRYGKDAHGATDKQFPLHFHIPDDKIVKGAADYVPGGGGAASGTSAAAAQDYAYRQLGRFGWGADQMNPLISLWNGESGWNYLANNPSSGAYGIPQALPGSKMASAGADWRTNPATQINWGLQYIKDRADYGSPSRAWAMWQSRSPHWYDTGGDLKPGDTLARNATNQVETVVTYDTRNQLLKALNTANVSYAGFTDILKGSIVPGERSPSFDTAPSNTYTYEVNINGANMSQKELERAVSDAINNKHRLDLKKSGRIK